MTPDIEATTAEEFSSNLEDLDTSEVRERRARAQQVENATSFVRRLAQGRLDIVAAELARRASSGEVGDLAELIRQLPDILSDGPSSGSGGAPGVGGRPPLELEPDSAVVADLSAQLDAICPMGDVSVLTELGDPALASMRDQVAAFEQDVSFVRRRLHDVIAALQAEITRRYMSGEESVESLLS